MKIDVKSYADSILYLVKNEVAKIPANERKALMVITAGENEANESYVRSKKRACEYCGIPFIHKRFGEDQKAEVSTEILRANADESIGGILVQLDLPKGWDAKVFTEMVDYSKDVDGLKRMSRFKPCTPEGVIHIMKQYYGPDLTGKDVLIIGRGKLVGEPLRKILQDTENCTVAVKHSKSDPEYGRVTTYNCPNYDCIVSATPVIQSEYDSDYCTALWIDCGIGRGKDGKLHGNYIPNKDKTCGADYTPVPGGVGLMTVAMLMVHMAKTMNWRFEI